MTTPNTYEHNLLKPMLIADLARGSGVEIPPERGEALALLLKLGNFCLNTQGSPVGEYSSAPENIQPADMPAMIVGLGFDYAIEVAPRLPWNENAIDLDALRDHVERIEETFRPRFGSLTYDTDLVIAAMEIMQQPEPDVLPGAGSGMN